MNHKIVSFIGHCKRAGCGNFICGKAILCIVAARNGRLIQGHCCSERCAESALAMLFYEQPKKVAMAMKLAMMQPEPYRKRVT